MCHHRSSALFAGGRDSARCIADATAFTLIEVLVVVAIIAILAALLLPSLQLAREQSKQVQCASNVHQQLIAAFAYAHDYKGSFPPSPSQEPYNTYLWTVVDFNTSPPYDFREIIRRHVGGQFHVFTCPTNGPPHMNDRVNEPFLRSGERWMGGQYMNLYNSVLVFKPPGWVLSSGTKPRPWAPKAEWDDGGPPATVPIIQDLYFVSGFYYINHGWQRLGSMEHEMLYHPPYGRYHYAREQSGCWGINVGYLDGHAAWTKNMKLAGSNRWTVDKPWSETTAGTLTVKAGFRN